MAEGCNRGAYRSADSEWLNDMTRRLLTGWKQIANAVGLTVRSAQRWEALYGLPVHRVKGADRGSVFAISEEIDKWLATRWSKGTPTSGSEVENSAKLARPHQATILAADDNDIHLYALHKALSAVGFNVINASTGSLAIVQAVAHAPDAILLDVNLPDVNGFDVCLRLKQEEHTANIPVIFHSAISTDEDSLRHAEAVGAAAFISFPLHVQHIIAVVKSCLARESWPHAIDRFNFDPHRGME
jgi:CheY-like chemotaxis protein